MKVTKKLAHEIQNRLTVVIGYLDLALETAKSRGESAGHIRKAMAAALDLAKLVKAQTVGTVDNCEACGAFIVRATLETKRENK